MRGEAIEAEVLFRDLISQRYVSIWSEAGEVAERGTFDCSPHMHAHNLISVPSYPK